MSDIQLSVKVERLVAQSGFSKSSQLISPVLKVIQMRYKDVSKQQALRVAKSVLG